MAKKSATAHIDALSEELVHALESVRQQGGDAYPPTLRRLAELCEGSPPNEDVVKAAGKKPFTSRAAVLEKENKKPKLDSAVYFNEDKPSAKELKARELARLSANLLQTLESRRQLRNGSYPPTFRQLAELCEGPPTLARAIEAAGKPPFSEQAVAIEKEKNKPKPDSPVYWKGDEPDPAKMMAERMLRVLESQRRLGGDSYPPTLRRLVELCESKTTDKRLGGALGLLANRLVFAVKGKFPNFDAPAVLADDKPKVGPALVAFALKRARTGTEHAFPAGKLTKSLPEPFKETVVDTLKRGRIEHLDFGPDVAWVAGANGEPVLFHIADLRPAARPTQPLQARKPEGTPAPRPDFAEAFREAFDQLDRRNGGTNFVKLAELRRALPRFGREEFDAGLYQLRADKQFSLNSHEGRHGTLTAEDHEAGIQEMGSFFIYASRR